ncbi:Arm DNA-binding domain-containing protein [Actinomadura sp. 21ATH]|uniref:Arm DNA-binding domain-containing protein n=1 Tax=Actinomadura sp. 21ATH TaxID=1735444 RepID=UPI0035C1F5C2
MTISTSAGGVYRRCGCLHPDTGKPWGRSCPKLVPGRRHGSWYLRLELSSDLDGRRRRIRRGGFASRKAAEAALTRLRTPSAGEASSSLLTVGDWLSHWLATRNRASSTVRGYTRHVRLYPSPADRRRRRFTGPGGLNDITLNAAMAAWPPSTPRPATTAPPAPPSTAWSTTSAPAPPRVRPDHPPGPGRHHPGRSSPAT